MLIVIANFRDALLSLLQRIESGEPLSTPVRLSPEGGWGLLQAVVGARRVVGHMQWVDNVSSQKNLGNQVAARLPNSSSVTVKVRSISVIFHRSTKYTSTRMFSEMVSNFQSVRQQNDNCPGRQRFFSQEFLIAAPVLKPLRGM